MKNKLFATLFIALLSSCATVEKGQQAFSKGDYQEANEVFLSVLKSDPENVEAMAALGKSYRNGKGEARDLSKSTHWYQKASERDSHFLGDYYAVRNLHGQEAFNANNYKLALSLLEYDKQKNPTSLVMLGKIYLEGYSTELDMAKSWSFYAKAEEMGNSDAKQMKTFFFTYAKALPATADKHAQFNIGVYYRNGIHVDKNDSKAAYWYEKSASQGVADAQHNLSTHYLNGEGVDKDYAKAFYWSEKAALQGDHLAQNTLGSLYEYGQGVGKNLIEAQKWYKLSAEGGNSEAKSNHRQIIGKIIQQRAEAGDKIAQYKLGKNYELGHDLKQNYGQAALWYKKSMEQGYAPAALSYAILEDEGKGVAQNYKGAYLKYISLMGSAQDNLAVLGESLYRMALHNYFGRGMAKNLQAAYSFFFSATIADHAEANMYLGSMHSNGYGTKKDDKEAFYFYQKAAQLGSMQGTSNLAVMYADGRGVSQDFSKAFELYLIAAKAGIVKAQENVGHYYAEGRGGVKKNTSESKKWYEKAFAQYLKSAHNGDQEARLQLFLFYTEGYGVAKDKERAGYYVRLVINSARRGDQEAQNVLESYGASW